MIRRTRHGKNFCKSMHSSGMCTFRRLTAFEGVCLLRGGDLSSEGMGVYLLGGGGGGVCLPTMPVRGSACHHGIVGRKTPTVNRQTRVKTLPSRKLGGGGVYLHIYFQSNSSSPPPPPSQYNGAHVSFLRFGFSQGMCWPNNPNTTCFYPLHQHCIGLVFWLVMLQWTTPGRIL